MEGKTLYVRVSKNRFVTIDFKEPPGGWFTDGHLQEILVAFADSFKDNYNATAPRIFRTPRCTFSLAVMKKSFKSFMFKPVEDGNLESYSSVPKAFCIRVLGRSDVGEALNGQAEVDAAMRLVSE